jgi:hypothetical protein
MMWMLRLKQATLKWYNFMMEYDNLSFKFKIVSYMEDLLWQGL